MRSILAVLTLSMLGTSAFAQTQVPEELTAAQKGYIAYDQCVMHAAIRASRTPAGDEEIFGIAKAECAAIRSALVSSQSNNRELLTALDAADADKAANFPKWIKGVRERRRQFDAGPATPHQ